MGKAGGGLIRLVINLVMPEEDPMRPASKLEAAHANYANPNVCCYLTIAQVWMYDMNVEVALSVELRLAVVAFEVAPLGGHVRLVVSQVDFVLLFFQVEFSTAFHLTNKPGRQKDWSPIQSY